MTNTYCPDILPDRIISEEIIDNKDSDIRTVIVTYKNNKNQTVRRTMTFRIKKKMVKVLRSIVERRNWEKFGKAATENNTNLVTFGDEVELSMEPKNKNSDISIKESKPITSTNLEETKPMLFRDRYKLDKFKKLKEDREDKYPEYTKPIETSTYIPPSRRNKNNSITKTYSIRISNIPDDITKEEMYQLGNPYGDIIKVFLPRDKLTGKGRGFGFIHYYKEEHMNLAIKGIDRKTYGYSILNVDIAKDIS